MDDLSRLRLSFLLTKTRLRLLAPTSCTQEFAILFAFGQYTSRKISGSDAETSWSRFCCGKLHLRYWKSANALGDGRVASNNHSVASHHTLSAPRQCTVYTCKQRAHTQKGINQGHLGTYSMLRQCVLCSTGVTVRELRSGMTKSSDDDTRRDKGGALVNSQQILRTDQKKFLVWRQNRLCLSRVVLESTRQ